MFGHSTRPQATCSSGTSRNWLPLVGFAACLCVLVAGLWLTFGAGSVRDFNRYRAFTSPSHRHDRCAAQAAIANQVRIREHFASIGGLTAEQAQGMGPVVGLTSTEMKSVVDAKLYPLELDCHDAVANPQVVVIGLILITGAVAAIGGALVGSRTRRHPRQVGGTADPDM